MVDDVSLLLRKSKEQLRAQLIVVQFPQR